MLSIYSVIYSSLYPRTPHESLVLPERAYRQFFRLVTSQVSLWYKDHSTPNPLGVEPDPAITRTVRGDKFCQEGVELLKEPNVLTRNSRKNFRRMKYNLQKILKK